MLNIDEICSFDSAIAAFVLAHVKNYMVVDNIDIEALESLCGVAFNAENSDRFSIANDCVVKAAYWMRANGFSKTAVLGENGDAPFVGRSLIMADCIRLLREVDGNGLTLERELRSCLAVGVPNRRSLEAIGFTLVGKLLDAYRRERGY